MTHHDYMLFVTKWLVPAKIPAKIPAKTPSGSLASDYDLVN